MMSQKQMLQSEVLEEILRERANYYISKKKSLDFWVLISPEFLKSFSLLEKIKETNFYNQQKNAISYSFKENNYDFYSALVSSDKEFITWISLRLGYFESIEGLSKKEIKTSHISDGVQGVLEWTKTNKISPLKSNKNLLHPEILINKYKKALEIYYLNSIN